MITRFAQVTHVYRLVVMVGAIMAVLAGCGGSDGDEGSAAITTTQAGSGNDLVAQGRRIFRFETFGDEAKVDRRCACTKS